MKQDSPLNFEAVLEQYASGAIAPAHARALLDATRATPRPRAGGSGGQDGGVVPGGIAVIGMAGEFPGALDIGQFWRNLEAGRITTGALPEDYLRGAHQPYRWGGVLSDRDAFDPAFFGIPAFEAHSMSPHQRLALRESWRALENAGIDPGSLAGRPVGVFLGAEPTGYVHETLSGASDAIVAGRVSYLLNLRGPALVVNTACSSSLVAIHLACESLRSGESSLALAGGVYAGLGQETLSALGQSGMLSPDGQCRTFDAAANGTVFSEGVAMLALKRLDDALADGDPIQGVIRASAVNHDGASNGITAPNGEAQERLILDAYRRFSIDVERIGYVEAHGTGTKLGDPIEANALARAFAQLTARRGFCRIGSAKAFIGHSGAAAGAIGVIKALLSLRHGRHVGMPSWRTLNPMIDLDGGAITIDDRPAPWPTQGGLPRMAAVTSLGLSGTNAHVVLEEFVAAGEEGPAERRSGRASGQPVLVPLSAATPDRLRVYAATLADALCDASASGVVPVTTPGMTVAPERRDGDAPPAGPDAGAVIEDLRVQLAGLLGVAPDSIDPDGRLDLYGVGPGHLLALAARMAERSGWPADLRPDQADPALAELTVAGLGRRIAGRREAQTGHPGPATAGRPADVTPADSQAEDFPPEVSLEQVAHTLQAGRPALAERAALIVGSLPDLIEKLRALAGGTTDIGGCVIGNAGGDDRIARLFRGDPDLREVVAHWFRRGDLARVAEVWTEGAVLSWPPSPCRRLSLPGYPFLRDRYGKSSAAAPAHPPASVRGNDAPMDPAGDDRGASIPAAVVPPPAGETMEPVDLAAPVGSWLASLVADTIGGQTVDPAVALDEYGVDSIARTRLNHLLSNAFPEASHTLLFEYRDLASLAGFLAARFPGECRSVLAGREGRVVEVTPVAAKEQSAPAAPSSPAGTGAVRAAGRDGTADGIAIVGISARFPGAPDIESFWDVLMTGRSVIGEIPADRWDWRAHYAPAPTPAERFLKSSSKWGAFLDGCFDFDPAFFNLMPVEARNIDPQERLFLEECWKALEDAGYARGKMPSALRRRAGVFAGASKHGFELAGNAQGLELPRTSFGALVNRVSYQLDFGGPSETTDAACSSAMVALHHACAAIRAGTCDLALVGGVNLYLHPSTYVELAATRMLSAGPECRAFGHAADGIVPGEGVAVAVLKPLGRALADGDPIYATILGSAVNHNGRTSGYTVPSPQRQADAIRDALSLGGIDPRTVSYIECSANGSEIGDAVEMTGLTDVFGGRTGVQGHYGVGSVKPNFGHGEAVSGMAQLLKVVLALGRRRLPPTRVPARINPAIDFGRLPFALQDKAEPWTPVVVDGVAAPLRAGVTSIGAGGVNAHVLLQEAPPAAGARAATIVPAGRGESLVPLSARTPDRLRAYVDLWIRYLDRTPGLDLARAAYTLQTGREDLRHRLAILAGDAAGLRDSLIRWRDGRPGAELFEGEADPLRAADPVSHAPGDPRDIARRWVTGERVDWASLSDVSVHPARLSGLPTYPFERRFCGADAGPESLDPVTAPPSAPGPAPSTGSRRLEDVQPVLEDVLTRILGVPAAELRRSTLRDLGLTSINAVTLIDAVNEAFGTAFPTSLAFEFGDSVRLAEHIARTAASHPGPVLCGARGTGDGDVAIVGLACRTPGAADADAFWDVIRDGRDALRDLEDPAALAFFHDHCPGARPPRFGAIPDADAFDSQFFRISPTEAAEMNPAQRVLLEECYHALEDAGYDPSSLRGQKVATVIGTNALPPQSSYTAHALLGSDCSVMAARLAYFLDLRGPALAVDTACSSSLVAIDTARRMVETGEADLALAGGVTVFTHPGIFVTMESLGILSPSRVCRPFDRDADGMLLGEGVGVLVLKRVADAKRDGNRIWGVIRGSGANQDGRTSGITAPSALAQGELIRSVIAESGIDAGDLGYLEAHGTGTKLGDPIEIEGLTEAFSALTDKRGFCAIGSIKGNIGHTTAAAGVLGAIKLLLSMRHGQLPPAANFTGPNPRIDFARSPVFVNPALAPWPRTASGVRLGAVSSFGYSGTNAHLVIEQPPAEPPVRPASRTGALLFPLSAANAAQLRDKAASLRAFLRREGPEISGLADIAATLQRGREAMDHRLVVKAGTTADLIAGLGAFLDGAAAERREGWALFTGHAGTSSVPAPATPALETAGKGAEGEDADVWAWCSGAPLIWDRLRGHQPGRLTGLPGHPFERRRFIRADGLARPPADPPADPKDDDIAIREEGRPTSVADGVPLSLAAVEAAATDWASARPELFRPETVRRAADLNRDLNDLSRDLLLAAFRAEGVFLAAGERHDADALARRLSVEESQRRLFLALLDMLADQGLLSRQQGGFVTTAAAAAAPDGAALRARADDLAGQFGEIGGFLPFLRNCAEAVPAILAGRRRPHEVLFPGGSFEALEGVYGGNESANELLAAIVGEVAAGRLAADPGVRFRVLEIGAGTGSASRHVLPALKPWADRVDYVYTDISKSFAQFGQRRFGKDYPFVAFQALDIERAPPDQGLEAGTFDIALASNVLHATRRMATTLANAASLLRPDGLLVMLEATEVRDYFTLTFGLTSGWWAYEDDRLPGSPLLSIPMWRRALQGVGFSPVRAWPLLGGTEERSAEAVIVARKPDPERDHARPVGMTAADRAPDPMIGPAGPSAAGDPPLSPVLLHAPAASSPALSSPLMPPPAADGDGDPWANGFERIVAEAWRDVLGQTSVGPADDFLDLGGDSILALQVASRLKQAFPLPLELGTLFEARTVREMAGKLEAEVIERIADLPEDTVSTLLGQTEEMACN